MLDLAQLVSDSLFRHGVSTTIDPKRLHWSNWFACAASPRLLHLPGKPGLIALAEEVVAPRDMPAAIGRRMLALFQLSSADDIGMALNRLVWSHHGEPLSGRRCFARYVVIDDDLQREAALISLRRWMASSVEVAGGWMGPPLASEMSQVSP